MRTELEQYYYHWMNIYKDCGQNWKRAAKKYRYFADLLVRDLEGDHQRYYYRKYMEAEALAASRLELLRDAPTTQQYMRASDIDEWFDKYDKWRVRVAEELGDED